MDVSRASQSVTQPSGGVRNRRLSPPGDHAYRRAVSCDDSPALAERAPSAEMSAHALHLHDRHQMRRQLSGREGEMWRPGGGGPHSPTGLTALLPYVSEAQEDERSSLTDIRS
jgi:hypothetical protein